MAKADLSSNPDDWTDEDIFDEEPSIYASWDDDPIFPIASAPVEPQSPVIEELKESEEAEESEKAVKPKQADATPKLTSQKGEKAIEPIIAALIDVVEGGAKHHSKLFLAGSQAGSRGANQADFIAAALNRLVVVIADDGSKWSGYDLQEAEQQLRVGWVTGNAEAEKKAALETAYRFDHLADRFRDEHPEYRWVVPKGQTEGGAWYRFDAVPSSRTYGIYAPITEEVFANSAVLWLRADEGAAITAGEKERAKEAGQAIERGVVAKMIAHLRGELAMRADLEAFNASPNEIVDGSGIRNLDTMEVREPTPDFYATRKLTLEGDPALYEKHKGTVEKIMASAHPEDRPLLDAFLGTVLRQEQPLSKTGLILFGPTKDNGKTSLMEALFGVLGDSADDSFGLKSAHAAIYRQSSNSYAEADMDNKTLTVFDDFAASHDVDFEKLKQLIGSGQGYKARQIRERTRSIRLVHTVIFTCNKLPNFGRGEDVIDRFEIIKFPYKYPRASEFDPTNPWHRERDERFTRDVRTNPEVRDAFYYYLLLMSKEWADSDSQVETEAISEHVRENKAEWMGKTNSLHAILTEYAAPSSNHFVTEKDLIGFFSEKLKEHGQGVLSQQSLRTELEMLTLFKEWRVVRHAKKKRSATKEIKDLIHSKWRPDSFTDASAASDYANIYAGIRLKTDGIGRFLDEDEWEAITNPDAIQQPAKSDGDEYDDLDDLADIAEDDADLFADYGS